MPSRRNLDGMPPILGLRSLGAKTHHIATIAQEQQDKARDDHYGEGYLGIDLHFSGNAPQAAQCRLLRSCHFHAYERHRRVEAAA